MAFFDEISRKITQTGQSAVQKTKEMADVAKLNTAIGEEKKRLDGYYAQIGRQYVRLHGSDSEDDFLDLVSAVRESEKRIDSCRQQIQNIKGVVICEKCGAEIAAQSAFCSVCGALVPRQVSVAGVENSIDMLQCIRCGKMVSREMKFCTSCGKPVAESIQAQQMSEGNEADNRGMVRCAGCGQMVPGDIKFCTFCGKPVVGSTQSELCQENVGNMLQPDHVEAAQPEAEPPMQETENVEGGICCNCGAVLEKDAVFCMECGSRVEG